MTTPLLKANFAVQNKYGAFYTGGVVQMSKDGTHLFCQCGHTVQCLDVQSGKPSSAIGQEEDDEITSFVLSPDDEVLVVAHRNLLLKQWNWKENVVTRTWKAIHTGPVSCMTFDVTSTLLATGGADATIKVWDVIKQYCTHNLHGHSGVISVVAFHPDIARLQLFSAGDDYKVRVWNLQTSSCVAALEGHYSVVTAIQFSAGGDRVYTAGRDNVVIVWDTEALEKLRTIPVYETIETLILMPEDKTFPQLNIESTDPHFVTGGSKGVLKVWNAASSQCVYPCTPADQEGEAEVGSTCAITAAQLVPALDALSVVTYDHNISIHDLQDFSPKKQFVGYNDDVLDMQFAGPGDSHLVVATNSQLVKVFEVTTWSCQVLHGHTDIVLSLGVHKKGTMFATGSKDNSLRVWQMEEDTGRFTCVAVGHGHTHAVNSVAFSRLSCSLLVSASHDCTLKTWRLPESFSGSEVITLSGSLTEHAHEKEINSVDVTPNDKMIATGSQDKTAKLWTADKLSLLGVFRGHKRSIWCLQFSPVDQALATASADTTIKIWSLSDFSCVKTLEGHQSSVLRLSFITRGMQIVSSGSDGLLKLWTIKTSECVGTWDEHDEKVWALAVPASEQTVATGAGDSTICIWKDVTEEEQIEALKKQEEFILQEQQLANLLQQKKYVKALGLAITLNQPYRVLKIFKELLDADGGREDAAQTLQKLRDDQIDSVLGYCSQWNTNSKHCHVAQFIVHVTLTRYSPEQLLKLGNIKSTIEALLPYTERHFQRMNRLQQQSTFVDFTWQSMKLVSTVPADAEEHMTSIKAGQSSATESGRTISITKDDSDSSSEEDSETADVERLIRPNIDGQMSSSDEDSSEEDSDGDSEEEDNETKRAVAKKTSQQANKAQVSSKKVKTNVNKVKNIQQRTPEKISISDKENNDSARAKKDMSNKKSPKKMATPAKTTKKQVSNADGTPIQQKKPTDSPNLSTKRRKATPKVPTSSAKRRKSNAK